MIYQIFGLIVLFLAAWIIASALIFFAHWVHADEVVKTKTNAFGLAIFIYNINWTDFFKSFLPKNDIQKEIAWEKAELNTIKAHKRDLEELERVRKEKQKVFNDVYIKTAEIDLDKRGVTRGNAERIYEGKL